MAKNSLEDYGWQISPDAFNGLDNSLANRLSRLQQSIGKLGLRKERYADTIRQALRDGRLREQEINSDLQANLKNMMERMAAKGLGKSGATTMLSGQLEKEAAAARSKAEKTTADSISSAQSQIKQINTEQVMGQEEIQRLLRQASQKYY